MIVSPYGLSNGLFNNNQEGISDFDHHGHLIYP